MEYSKLKLEIKNRNNKFIEFINECENKKIILFGAGQGVVWAIKLLKKYNVKISCIVDNDIKKHGEKILDIPIVALKSVLLKEEGNDCIVLITSPRYEVEIRACLESKIDQSNIYSFECELYHQYIHDIEEYRSYLIEKFDEIVKLEASLEDKVSKETLENVILGRLTGDLNYFRKVYNGDQYFPKDIINLSSREVIVDAGAGIGDTLIDIYGRLGNDYGHVYSFEPDEQCYFKTKSVVLSNNMKEVTILKKGLWDKNSILYFKESDIQGSSKTVESEGNGELSKIEVVELDSIIKTPISFIKMDIEGAELNALKGAKSLIKKYKPKLAICVYHKNEDIIEIPNLIKSLVPEYKLYLRHHNISGTETVLYAIIENS